MFGRFIQLCLYYHVLLSNSAPNIFMMIVDDLGWADANFNRENTTSEVRTPHIDALAVNGLRLERHYVHYECTPSRASFQTGRLPYHVNLGLHEPTESDCGIPRRMTCIASKLKSAGYSTHMIGKWDVGMATPQHTPRGRGYDTSLIYFGHMNDYWTQRVYQTTCTVVPKHGMKDMWMNYAPAKSLYSSSSKISTDSDTDDTGSDTSYGYFYEEQLFYEKVLQTIDKEAETPDDPFFIVYASHVVHYPMQVPQWKYEEFNFDDDESYCSMSKDMIFPLETEVEVDDEIYRCRSLSHSMVSYIDTAIGKIHSKLVDLNLWENTLFVFTTDNGGSYLLTYGAGNNYPLRGGKFTPFEGGIRAISFVSGGYLPESRRGKSESGLMHICDWYSTFCYLAGIDPEDETADYYDLPQIDSLNMWPMLSGEDSISPRTEIVIDINSLIVGDYKYLSSESIDYAGWTGEIYPNSSSLVKYLEDINIDCSDGCLYNLAEDELEYENLIDIEPEMGAFMKERLDVLMESYWLNSEVGEDSCPSDVNISCGCWMAFNYWEGFYGPFQYMEDYRSLLYI